MDISGEIWEREFLNLRDNLVKNRFASVEDRKAWLDALEMLRVAVMNANRAAASADRREGK